MHTLLSYLTSVSGGVWLGIVALVLSYPIAILAIVTTPMLQDWWSRRSRRSLEKRLKELTAWQVKVRDEQADQNTAHILTGIQSLIVLVGIGIQLILMLVHVGLTSVTRSHRFETDTGVYFFVNGVLLGFSLALVERAKQRVSPHYRDAQNERINRLQEQLAKLGQQKPTT